MFVEYLVTLVTLRSTMFNTQKLYVLPTQFVYIYCMDLRTNSNYFPAQH